MYNSLTALEEHWNEVHVRHPAYKDSSHPVNFNLGKVHGGNWASSVPSECTLEFRVGFYPGMSLETVKSELENTLAAAAESKGIAYELVYEGFQAEGCEFTQGQMVHTLSKAHKLATGQDLEKTVLTCTTDVRFFELYHGIEATCYGPEAKNIHGIDECVKLSSVLSVAKVLALFIADWCGLEPCHAP